MSAVQLKLNSEAVATLFPEGTPARVELQNAVVAEFLRKNIKPQLLQDNLQSQIDRQVKDATKEALKDLGVVTTWASLDLTQKFKNDLQSRVRDSVDAITRDAIQAYVNSPEFIEWRNATINSTIAGSFGRALETAVKDRLAVVAETLAKAKP